jgi:hypothetical protein
VRIWRSIKVRLAARRGVSAVQPMSKTEETIRLIRSSGIKLDGLTGDNEFWRVAAERYEGRS